MIYLLLSIFFSAFTVSFFKIFEIKKVHTFQAIIVNYLTCSIIGSFFAETKLWQAGLWQADWLLYAAILGCLFIAIFYCIALTAQKISVSTSMVAAKLSVVVPVLMAFFLYHETLNGLKIFGILVSLMAVFFISRKSKSDPAELAHFWYLPLLVFMGSGAPVRAAAPGVVVSASYQTGYGNAVVINHGGGVATLYAHLSAFNVRAGQTVTASMRIASVGSTGYATGPHLHFEVRVNGVPVDPLGWL